MSRIMSKAALSTGSKFDVITDLDNHVYVTDVYEIFDGCKGDNRKRSQKVESVVHQTQNLTAVLRKHDEIVEKLCKN